MSRQCIDGWHCRPVNSKSRLSEVWRLQWSSSGTSTSRVVDLGSNPSVQGWVIPVRNRVIPVTSPLSRDELYLWGIESYLWLPHCPGMSRTCREESHTCDFPTVQGWVVPVGKRVIPVTSPLSRDESYLWGRESYLWLPHCPGMSHTCWEEYHTCDLLSRVESYLWLKKWHSRGYHAWCLALWGQG